MMRLRYVHARRASRLRKFRRSRGIRVQFSHWSEHGRPIYKWWIEGLRAERDAVTWKDFL